MVLLYWKRSGKRSSPSFQGRNLERIFSFLSRSLCRRWVPDSSTAEGGAFWVWKLQVAFCSSPLFFAFCIPLETWPPFIYRYKTGPVPPLAPEWVFFFQVGRFCLTLLSVMGKVDTTFFSNDMTMGLVPLRSNPILMRHGSPPNTAVKRAFSAKGNPAVFSRPEASHPSLRVPWFFHFFPEEMSPPFFPAKWA